MFRQKQWAFVGESGREYVFTILPKSSKAPQEPGVFVMAYTHPRGHMAGWQVNPLFIGHGENLREALENGAELGNESAAIWNSNFVLLEPVRPARETCVEDLRGLSVLIER